jgi:hypothetical protein
MWNCVCVRIETDHGLPAGRSQTRAVEYLGEEIGNLIDPSATQASNKQQHAFIMALEQAAEVAALYGDSSCCSRVYY